MKSLFGALLAGAILLLATSVAGQTNTPSVAATAVTSEDQELLRRCTELFGNRKYHASFAGWKDGDERTREYLFTVEGLKLATGGPQKGLMVCVVRGDIRFVGEQWSGKTWVNWFRDERSIHYNPDVPGVRWLLFANADGTLHLKTIYQRYVTKGLQRVAELREFETTLQSNQ